MLIVYTIFIVLLLFSLTIFVHELGHFLVARWCGMTAEVFSLGFGPALWKRKIGDVTYKIGILPFGGYVALPQMDPGFDQESTDRAKALPRVPPWKKILVALAGVTGNMILAVFLAYVIYWVGKPSSPDEWNTVVGYVDPASRVYAEGLRIGDEIVSINDQAVHNWNEINTEFALNEQVALQVNSAEGPKNISLPTETSWLGVRILPGLAGENYCKVAAVLPDSSAAAAGIQPDDLILSLDGIALHSREQLIQLIQERSGREVPVRIRRGDQELELPVTPRADEATGKALIGVQFNTMFMDTGVMVHPDPWEQIRGHTSLIFRFLGALFTPKQARIAAQGVGGPPAILFMFWWAVQSSFIIALWFTCLLNVNLAVLNLLPVPILDGGHIVFALWEAISRRPVSPRLVGALSNTFAVLLIMLFLFLSYRDIVRLIMPTLFPSDKSAVESPAPAETNVHPAPSP